MRAHEIAKRPELCGEAYSDPLAGGLDRVAGKVGVAGGCLNLVVAECLAIIGRLSPRESALGGEAVLKFLSS